MSTNSTPHATAQTLRNLLHSGLPLAAAKIPPELLELRAVSARTAQPDNPNSRALALDAALRWQLAQYSHSRWAEAARILFGTARGATGLTLTERREKAAAAAGYETHHFRKHIEPKICAELAAMLNADSDNLRSRATPPPLAPARAPLKLPADVLAWEAAEHEQALAELWSHVYALRAALLATAVTAAVTEPGSPAAQDSARTAAWRLALLLAAASSYQTAYGPSLLGADPNTDPADLAALAGWQPPLTADAAISIAHVVAEHPDRGSFLAGAEDAIGDWCRALANQTAPTTEGES